MVTGDTWQSLSDRVIAVVRSQVRRVRRRLAGSGDPFEVFLTSEALAINQARQDHLASLELDLNGKTVLEVGAGIGLHTKFFEDRECSVLCTDGRPENVAELLRRYPHRRAQVLDLDEVGDLSALGMFDVVYCYGLLYHLSRPEQALQALARVCREMILLETCVTPGEEVALHPEAEDAWNPNQASSGLGCRPTRPWVMAMLKKHFGHAYISATQPRHPDFDLTWAQPISKPLHRAVFVGAKAPLANAHLRPALMMQQVHDLAATTRG